MKKSKKNVHIVHVRAYGDISWWLSGEDAEEEAQRIKDILWGGECDEDDAYVYEKPLDRSWLGGEDE